MAISVVMPALEMAQETGKLVSWKKKDGENVRKGELLLEVHPPVDAQGQTMEPDVDLLAQHFLHGYSQRYRKNISGFDTAALKALHEHAWPGNVRELDHAVERGVLLSPGPSVRAADLGLRAQAAGAAAKLEEMSLDEVERYLIQRTLSRHEGNVSQAAKALGLSRSAMYRRLQKHGLE